MSRGKPRVLVVILLLLATLPGLPGTNASGTGVQWFGSTDPHDGFHMRLPIVVRNNQNVPLVDAPAYVELDLAQKLLEAGWISQAQGDRSVLRSFEFDVNSIRVVEVSDLQPSSGGPAHGHLMTYDPSRLTTDPRRYEVPSVAFMGNLQAPNPAPFDPKTNPLVTVIWRVEGTLQPFATSAQERTFMLYFDSTQNGAAPPASYDDVVGGAALASLFWQGTGVTLYGNVAPGSSQVGAVNVIPLYDGTVAKVSALTDAGTYQAVVPPSGFPTNPVTLSRLQPQRLFVASGHPSAFRIDASHPVIAFVDGTGFVPSLAGGLVGNDFVFPLDKPQIWEQDSIYFSTTGTDETVVQVRPLEGGQAYTFEMNNVDNPSAYTTGARAGPFSDANGAPACFVANPADMGPLLTHPGYYRATVLRGDPVMLQIAPTRAMVQVPSVLGAPTGTKFMTDLGWTDRSAPVVQGSSCLDSSRVGSFIAASVGDATTLKATNDGFPGQVYPLSHDPNHVPPPASVGAAPGDQDGPHLSPLLDRPVTFQAADPVALLAGLAPPIGDVRSQSGYPNGLPDRVATGVPLVEGPVGGAGFARTFSTYGPTTVIALFNDTAVSSDVDYASAGRVHATTDLGSQAFFTIANPPDDQVVGVRLDANRPLIVVPRATDSAALASVPTFLSATAMQAEYRGYLVRLSSPSGLNPVTDSVAPGGSINYTVTVDNLGHGIGGANLPDTILVTAAAPAGWDVRIDGEASRTVSLQSAETHDFQVTVTPPADLPAGSIGQVTVTATSNNNPKVGDSLQLVAFLKRSFGVGIWFDQQGNPMRTQTKPATRGAPTEYHVVLRNLGGTLDTFDLATTDAHEPAWSIVLQDPAGKPVDAVTLGAGKTLDLDLVVTAAAAAADGTVLTGITATSSSEPSVQDQLSAITKLRSPADVSLATPNTTLYLAPGAVGAFPLILSNTGSGSAELTFSASVTADPVWNITGIVVRDSGGLFSQNLSALSIAPGQTATLYVVATARPDAPAWAFGQSLVTVRVSGTLDALDAVLQASVVPVHRLDQVLPPLPLLAATGSTNLSATVRVTNHGNLAEDLRVRTLGLPADWTLQTANQLSIARGATQELRLALHHGALARPGPYNVTVGLDSADGNLTLIRLPALVGSFAAAQASSPANQLLGRPGADSVAHFVVSNDGNVPVNVHLHDAAGEPWRWSSPQADVQLPPQATMTVAVAFEVPADAPDGQSIHGVGLDLRPSDPSSPMIARTLTATVDVARPDLVIERVQAFQGPGGDLARATIKNQGLRPTGNVTVQLVADGVVEDQLLVQQLWPGATANLTMQRTEKAATSARVVVDPSNAVPESDETNNAMDVPVARHSGGSSPGFGLADTSILALLAFAACAARRR